MIKSNNLEFIYKLLILMFLLKLALIILLSINVQTCELLLFDFLNHIIFKSNNQKLLILRTSYH